MAGGRSQQNFTVEVYSSYSKCGSLLWQQMSYNNQLQSLLFGHGTAPFSHRQNVLPLCYSGFSPDLSNAFLSYLPTHPPDDPMTPHDPQTGPSLQNGLFSLPNKTV